MLGIMPYTHQKWWQLRLNNAYGITICMIWRTHTHTLEPCMHSMRKLCKRWRLIRRKVRAALHSVAKKRTRLSKVERCTSSNCTSHTFIFIGWRFEFNTINHIANHYRNPGVVVWNLRHAKVCWPTAVAAATTSLHILLIFTQFSRRPHGWPRHKHRHAHKRHTQLEHTNTKDTHAFSKTCSNVARKT